MSCTCTSLKPSTAQYYYYFAAPKAHQQTNAHLSIQYPLVSLSFLSIFPLLLLMVLRLPFPNRQPWFDFLLNFSLKTKSKDTSSYLTIFPSISSSVMCAGWAMAAACSTEVSSWAAMPLRQAKKAQACWCAGVWAPATILLNLTVSSSPSPLPILSFCFT